MNSYLTGDIETTNKTEKLIVAEKSSEKIITAIKNNANITIKELSALFNLTERAIEKNISKLKSKGIIKRVGADKGGYWKILKGAE